MIAVKTYLHHSDVFLEKTLNGTIQHLYVFSMIFKKFAYTDNLALLHSSGNWKDLKGTLSQDMSTFSAYLQTWTLKFNYTNTVTVAFHLNNREAKRELKVYNNGRLLQFSPTPTYLGVKLDRSLTFRHHLAAFRKKNILARHTAEATCRLRMGCWCQTLRIATLSLVYSTAEYCAPVWCRSAHTRLIDSVLNDALHIVTGCLRFIPRTIYPYFQASSQLSFADWKRHSPWLAVDLRTLIVSCMVF